MAAAADRGCDIPCDDHGTGSHQAVHHATYVFTTYAA